MFRAICLETQWGLSRDVISAMRGSSKVSAVRQAAHLDGTVGASRLDCWSAGAPWNGLHSFNKDQAIGP